MNSLILSPAFPPHHHLYCAALRARGLRVLGLGDVHPGALPGDVARSLDDYLFVPSLDDDDAVLRAVGLLIHRHGRIEHVDSLNEHWLEREADIRLDFHVPGPLPDLVARLRSKSAMADAFRAQGLEVPACVRARDREAVRALARESGFPLVLKPDVGVGAEGARVVEDAGALEEALASDPEELVAQPYVRGRLTSFDGLVDADGVPVFTSSFVYSDGVLEIVRDQRDVFYYTRRVIPPALEAAGLAMVRAFDLRARFFHAELFELEDGTFVPLELNARPPGGYSVDLVNYCFDFDAYRLWAGAVAGDPAPREPRERRYHAAHVSRRPGRAYARSHEEVVRTLGDALVFWRDLPAAFAHVMGSPVYVVRHTDDAALRDLVDVVHAR